MTRIEVEQQPVVDADACGSRRTSRREPQDGVGTIAVIVD